MWAAQFRAKWRRFNTPEVAWFIEQVIRRTQSRAGNQAVNAEIQGTCATLAKRAIRTIKRRMAEMGWTKREGRFMMPIHDELVWSVHRSKVREFIELATEVMTTLHPDIFSRVVLDCTPSIGLTFEPWHEKKARTGQIELREAPDLPFVPRDCIGGALPPELWGDAVDWLFAERERLAA
jgi:hypothetical protein